MLRFENLASKLESANLACNLVKVYGCRCLTHVVHRLDSDVIETLQDLLCQHVLRVSVFVILMEHLVKALLLVRLILLHED